MLRSTRGLLLLAIILMLGAVAATYYQQKRTLARQSPQAPKTLPSNTDASASGWEYRKDEESHCIFVVRAKHFSQLKDPLAVELEGVEVLICKDEGRQYDRIRSAKALFDQNHGTLYSDGEVDIEMGVPAEGQPQGRLLRIHSSGVTYDTKSGRASTDRAASFEFEQSTGKCVGAIYDPTIREIYMRDQVELNWRKGGPDSRPLKVEAGNLIYKERDSYVLLRPWSRLTRETGTLEGGEAVVTLKDGVIEKVEAKDAHGNDRQPGRNLEYSADRFMMAMTPKGEVQKIVGEPNAHMVSVTDSARTTVTSQRVDLDFDTAPGNGSELRQALTWDHTVLESAPIPHKNVPLAETRVVRSDRMLLKMRPGGREIESVETMARGRLEFLPNRAGQRHRTLDADRMFVTYGPANIIRTFTATNAATRTDPEPQAKNAAKQKTPPAPSLTWSKDLKGDFDPKTGQLVRMEQWNDFRYEEGERRARAYKATLEEARNLITLEKAARIWDTSGATSADRILLDQKSGDVNAEGNVVSTRMPDHKDKSSAMLSNDQPLEAKAHKMVTTARNQKIHYEGQAVAWQGANRIWGDTIDIDRTVRSLIAHGHVRTQLVEQAKDAPDKKAASTPATPAKAPDFIMVTSTDLVYTEANRLAHYTGGVHLVRTGMDVKSAGLRAYLNDSNADSSLHHAFADGQVAIVRKEPERTLTGTGEHAEYYVADERIFLNGGEPALVDSVRGVTRGRELTYFANDDKLLVNGAEKEPVKTRVLRRR
jgi:lipopolysaccharide export system protein LptA